MSYDGANCAKNVAHAWLHGLINQANTYSPLMTFPWWKIWLQANSNTGLSILAFYKFTWNTRDICMNHWRSNGMTGMARPMDATVMGAQKLLGKNKNLFLIVSSTSSILGLIQQLLAKLHQHSALTWYIKTGHGAPAPPNILTKLWDCDTTWRSDIVTEQRRSLAVRGGRSQIFRLRLHSCPKFLNPDIFKFENPTPVQTRQTNKKSILSSVIKFVIKHWNL